MTTKHQVHNLIILDESGSMQSIKPIIINGFNELVQSIKGIEAQFPEQEHLISIVAFNDFGNKLLHFTEPVCKLNSLNSNNYNPASMTPLFDAMGFGISTLKKYLEGKTDYNVLVTILTDGEENSSKEYTGIAIKAMVDELKNLNWTFTYIGADHDVEKMASTMSINNTMSFNKDTAGITNMFKKERASRISYSEKIRDKKDASSSFYEDHKDITEDTAKPKENNSEPKASGFWNKFFGKN